VEHGASATSSGRKMSPPRYQPRGDEDAEAVAEIVDRFQQETGLISPLRMSSADLVVLIERADEELEGPAIVTK